jgi:hypothetical protein
MLHREQKLKEWKQAQRGNDLVKSILQAGLSVLCALCAVAADSPKAPFFLHGVWGFIAGSVLWSRFIAIVDIHTKEPETSKLLRLKTLPCLQALQLRRKVSCAFWRSETLPNRSAQTKEELRRTFSSDNKPSFDCAKFGLAKVRMG